MIEPFVGVRSGTRTLGRPLRPAPARARGWAGGGGGVWWWECRLPRASAGMGLHQQRHGVPLGQLHSPSDYYYIDGPELPRAAA